MFVSIIAHVVFWILLAAGWDELPRPIWLTFLAIWIAGYFVASQTSYGLLFAPFIALIDVVLVFWIFRGDVPLR